MAQPLNGSNGTNGSSAPRLPASDRIARDFSGSPARDNGHASSYAAVLVIGPLTDNDIADFVRAGHAVRPFLEIDESLAALVLGSARENRLPLREIPSADSMGPAKEPRAGESGKAASVVQEQVSTHDSAFATDVCAQLDSLVPSGPIRELFRLSARKTRKRLTALQAAEAIGIEREKLTSLLRDAGFPPPQEVIRQHRLLHASWLFGRTPRRTVDEVAKALGFASGPVLSNAMRASMGAPPKELEKRGGFRLAIAQFKRVLQGAKPNEAPEQRPIAP